MLTTTTLFSLLTFISFLNYVDRGIIPGASEEFNGFIDSSLGTSEPDKWLGLLQSVFVAGFSVACLPMSHLLHFHRWNTLLSISLVFWTLVLVCCGLAGEQWVGGGGYWYLLIARGMTGVSEATFQCIIPPLLQDRSDPKWTATVLGIYFAAIPFGTAVGYIFGAGIAANHPWRYCYYIEACSMVPVLAFCFGPLRWSEQERGEAMESETQGLLSAESPLISGGKRRRHALSNNERRVSQLPNIGDGRQLQVEEEGGKPTMGEELSCCLGSPIFLLITMSYAVYTGSIVAVATFGPAFFLALGFFEAESTASFTFGLIISIGGIVGTPLGGVLIDWVNKGGGDDNDVEGNLLLSFNDDSNDSSINWVNKGEDDDNDSSVGETARVKYSTVRRLLLVMSAIIVSGGALMWIVVVTNIRVVFIVALTAGCTILFASTSFFNLISMLSVPSENRGFAVGLLTMLIHIFGDVPSPIIIGYVKDRLAPLCNVDADGTFVDLDGCRGEKGGIRETLAIVFGWLTLCPVLALIAAGYAGRKEL